MKTCTQLCAALMLLVSTTAHALEFAEVKTTTGCDITVASMRAGSTYLWDGQCVGGKAEGLGTFVQKLRVDENLSNLYYSTQTRHAGIAYGYTTLNFTRRDPSVDVPEKVTFYFEGARIGFTRGWGWSLEGLLVGGGSMSLPSPASPEALPGMSIESPTAILNLLATTCATEPDDTPACKSIGDRYRTIYLIRQYDAELNVVKRRVITPCPDIFNIASCQPLLAQKSAPLRAEILAFLQRAKPSVDALLENAHASRPNQRPLRAAAQLPPPMAEVAAAPATPGVVDAALPVFDSKVPFPSRLGSMLWLDANTLAITTSPRNEFWNGTTVAVDVAARSASVILEHGFLNCASDGLVAMLKGSLARDYAGGLQKPGAPDPVRVFYRWNAKARRLDAEEPDTKPGWSWQICAQTRADDVRRALVSYHGHNMRYLKPADGVLQWDAVVYSRVNPTPPVFLAKPGSAAIPVDVDADDIALRPAYLPFNTQYLLTAGRFLIGGSIDHKGKMVDQLPAITMTRDGKVSRHMLPPSLKAALSAYIKRGGGDGSIQPTAAGLLVINNAWPATGGGLYVSQGAISKRVWCVPADHNGESCALEQLEISPDGCQVAFVARNDYPKTVKVLRLCPAGSAVLQ
jgi:hypothetical protein